MPATDSRSVRVAVLGSPIAHSLSPALHCAAYAALGLTWWHYSAIECDESGLPEFLDSCGPDWVGLSLTMPLKRAVLPLLDRSDQLVTQVGGANTVLFAAERRLGYNTDVPGMVRALAEHDIGAASGPAAQVVGAPGPAAQVAGAPGPAAISASRAPGQPGTASDATARSDPVFGDAGPALVLGAGATACAALAALRQLGETLVAVAVRDPDRTWDLRAAADRIGVKIEWRPFEPASAVGVPLIISTVPAGAADPFARNFAFTGAAPDPAADPAVFDVVYHPWPTVLATAALRAGAAVISGFDLLLHQAAAQVELMTGRPAPLGQMRDAGLAELAKRGR